MATELLQTTCLPPLPAPHTFTLPLTGKNPTVFQIQTAAVCMEIHFLRWQRLSRHLTRRERRLRLLDTPSGATNLCGPQSETGEGGGEWEENDIKLLIGADKR